MLCDVQDMKNQLFKFRCKLIEVQGFLWWKKPVLKQDFEYVIGGHHYVSTAEDEVVKYCQEQFGRWPKRYEDETMHGDYPYWEIDLISIGDSANVFDLQVVCHKCNMKPENRGLI